MHMRMALLSTSFHHVSSSVVYTIIDTHSMERWSPPLESSCSSEITWPINYTDNYLLMPLSGLIALMPHAKDLYLVYLSHIASHAILTHHYTHAKPLVGPQHTIRSPSRTCLHSVSII